MMAMLDAKAQGHQEQRQQMQESPSAGDECWNDVHDPDLSPIRKHLISSYLQVSDEEAMPLLGEYFGVALSFVALGALVRASNSTTKKRKQQQQGRATATTEDDSEGLDLRACSRFQRMALESMLKESMERLRVLSQNAYHLEDRVKYLEEENFAQDKERVHLVNRLMEAEKAVQELRALRKAEGRANEKVMGIVATKEQDWIKEKRSLQKEAERLKETVKAMTKEAKLHARRSTNPICEHCQGIEEITRSTSKGGGGRTSLRDLRSPRDSESSASERQVLLKAEQPQQQQRYQREGTSEADTYLEDEEDKIIMKAIEMKKNVSEKLGSLKGQQLNEKTRYTDWRAADNPGNEDWRSQSDESVSSSGLGSSGQFPATQEGLVKQEHNMESDLANILKRVGTLRQRSYSTVGVLDISTSKVGPSGLPGSSGSLSSDEVGDVEPLSPLYVKGKDLSKLALVEEDSSRIVVHAEITKRSMTTSEPSVLDATFEFAEYASERSHRLDEPTDLNDIGESDIGLKDEEDEEAPKRRSSRRQSSMALRDELEHESSVDDKIVAAAVAEKLQTEDGKPLEGVGNLAGDDSSDERGSGGTQGHNSNREDATDAALSKEDQNDDKDDSKKGKSAFLNRPGDEYIQHEEGKERSATSECSRGDYGADLASPQARDDYRSEEPKQVVEVVEGCDINKAPWPSSNITDRFSPSSDSGASPVVSNRVDEPSIVADAAASTSNTAASEGQEDIPVVERETFEDLAGELSEPGEKRACGSDEPFDSSDASPATGSASLGERVTSTNEDSNAVEQMNDDGLQRRAMVSNDKKAAGVTDDEKEKQQATLRRKAAPADN